VQHISSSSSRLNSSIDGSSSSSDGRVAVKCCYSWDASLLSVLLYKTMAYGLLVQVRTGAGNAK
jgi:hypothetical protein